MRLLSATRGRLRDSRTIGRYLWEDVTTVRYIIMWKKLFFICTRRFQSREGVIVLAGMKSAWKLTVYFVVVVREPPYSVKESGYAGFNFPIEIYLRNRDEPKRIKFNYDLHLQNSGPPIIKVQKEKYVFSLPNDEFKHKLLKGGGSVGVLVCEFWQLLSVLVLGCESSWNCRKDSCCWRQKGVVE